MKLIRYELYVENKYVGGLFTGFPFYPEDILTKKEIKEHDKLLKQLPFPKSKLMDSSKVKFYFTEEGNLRFYQLILNIKKCLPNFIKVIKIDINEYDNVFYKDQWQVAIIE
jgi:hypothetical protein